jgi:hypothetical protein
VEIWSGQTITIDATGSHSGEIDADVGQSGGTNGTGWIDIFGRGDVTILGGASNYAVHANMPLPNGRAGDVRVVSHAGRFSLPDWRSRRRTRPSSAGDGSTSKRAVRAAPEETSASEPRRSRRSARRAEAEARRAGTSSPVHSTRP